ncbi:MAG: outer membrane protein transport protein [Betaproteobacteria bacterium]|nr:outer membrane protein transport protein [Betaproteobacteria bacterium]MDE1982540.1 outer membrane protein transport protein [Betaproteobacteria bacterium]MDE2131588.1 outer membrane protein transport protein [Betaproteobacteria bacterium]MDE2211702.1 outer membrane protein transport protein [Betaproteobacteria bacterium]MDE2625327.1 outer membrane protein transport protein [Betaproteobacteria bacterium]
MTKRSVVLSLVIAGGLVSPLAQATNGYFAIGYGQKSVGMGGVGIALPQDALAAASNPAGMVWVGDRTDLGLEWFRPTRSSSITGNGVPGVNGQYDGNATQDFFIPEFGYNRMVNDRTSLGVAVFGNGGMNTDYSTNPFGVYAQMGGIPNPGSAGVNLAQMFISPTWSMKLNPSNSIGVSLNLAYQQFSAKGLYAFGQISNNPSALTNNGTDYSTGYGARFGWTGKVTDAVTLGATYQTRTNMGKLSNYSGLFAGQGSFDIPANYGVGLAVKATPTTTLAADVERIQYSDVGAVANPIVFPPTGPATMLGGGQGSGFGWQDMTVFKLGVSHDFSSTFTLRAGWNHNNQQIPSTQTFFNILAPGVVQDHLTLGATWKLPNKGELTVAYMHAISKTVNGSGSIPAGFGGGNANLTMYEDSLGISYGW